MMSASAVTPSPVMGDTRLSAGTEVRDVVGKEETMEHLRALLHQEETVYPLCSDYFSAADIATSYDDCTGSSSDDTSSSSDRVSEAWRRKLCEWQYEVTDHFNFDREVVFYALQYLDRAVSVKTATAGGQPLPKRDFQLLAVTALYMAVKVHGETDDVNGPRRKLRINAFVELSRGFFSVQVIETMEREMLQLLKWRVNPPSSLRFVSTYLSLCPQWALRDSPAAHASVTRNLFDVSRYLCELAVCVSAFSFEYKTSVTAYAAILCALEALPSPLPYDVRTAFLNNVAEATGLYPGSEEVRKAYLKIKELCPSLFANIGNNEAMYANVSPLDGKESPVSVVDSCSSHPYCTVQQQQVQHPQQHQQLEIVNEGEESPRTRRKRSRPCVSTSDEPVQRQTSPHRSSHSLHR